MFDLSGSEFLFWSGLVLMAGVILLAGPVIGYFTIKGRKIKKKLEQEYGEPRQ